MPHTRRAFTAEFLGGLSAAAAYSTRLGGQDGCKGKEKQHEQEYQPALGRDGANARKRVPSTRAPQHPGGFALVGGGGLDPTGSLNGTEAIPAW